MPRKALTARSVASEPAPPSGRVDIHDTTLPGFVLRVSSSGVKTYALTYRERAGGKLRRLTIGRHPLLGLADARKLAREALEAVARGEDPAAERQAEKAARDAEPEPEPERDTVARVAQEYIERHAKPNTRKWQQTEQLLNLYLIPALGDRDLSAVTRRDVRDLIDAVVDQGRPVQANRVLAAVKAMCAWAVEREIIDVSPAAAVKKPTREQERDRVLTADELVAVWRAADGLGYPGGAVVKMLILTATRRDEARLMRWSEIDMAHAVWALSGERSKNGRPHTIPLSSAALAVLDDMPTFEGCDYVFSATGAGPYTNVQKPKAALDRESGVTGWTLHDLRRTAASGMGDLGIPGETIARVLNHSERAIAGVTSRYNRADQTEAKRRALEAWGNHVMALAGQGRSAVAGTPFI